LREHFMLNQTRRGTWVSVLTHCNDSHVWSWACSVSMHDTWYILFSFSLQSRKEHLWINVSCSSVCMSCHFISCLIHFFKDSMLNFC
jgi:hypothetical protein